MFLILGTVFATKWGTSKCLLEDRIMKTEGRKLMREVTLGCGFGRKDPIGKRPTGDFIPYEWLIRSFFRPWNIWNIKKNYVLSSD